MAQDKDEHSLSEQKRIALDYLTEAWDEAVAEGIESDVLAHAALFAALSDLIDSYGEEPVAELVTALADRIRRSEFTVSRALH